ncbi:hypothetical protein AVEN_230265-1 [Araneus ventricosus]|uniref:Tc1-like transposase DDE domain-containing protein n=1 Tax=Araneus ventricosus TaxID=182803 RepID=A0A4Y2VHD5_ARAVE|nr:hypothetical protein AVEN_230265-1 [Araneus ventricosus]
MKEDCSHDDLLFVCLCPQRTSERGCIGPVNIAVGHQSSGSHVLFTDESRFNIQNDSRRAMIWREPGTRYRGPNIIERDHYRSGGLLVWVGIATNGLTDLYMFAGVPSQLCDIATKSYTLLCGLYRCNGHRRNIYGR